MKHREIENPDGVDSDSAVRVRPSITDPLDKLNKYIDQKRVSGTSDGALLMRSDIARTNIEASRIALAAILYHEFTEAFTGCVTLVNFLCIILDADARAAGRDPIPLVQALNWLCFMIFAGELLVRVHVERLYVLQSYAGWLDVTVVSLGLIGELLEAVELDFSMLRIFRIVRLGRLSKAFALMSAFHELRKLIHSLVGVLRTLFWSAILLFFTMTMWSVVAVILIQPLMDDVASNSFWKECPRCARAFSSVSASNLTFLQTIVVGDDWGILCVPIIERYPWTIFIFGGSLITMGLGMLNLIVAIIVDTAAEARAHDDTGISDHRSGMEKRERQMLEKLFGTMDCNNSGTITIDELRLGALSNKDLKTRLRALDISGDDLAELFVMMDEDGSGAIDMDEFIDTLYRMKCGNDKTAMSLVKQYVSKLRKDQNQIAERVHRVHEAFEQQTDKIRNEISKELSQIANINETSMSRVGSDRPSWSAKQGAAGTEVAEHLTWQVSEPAVTPRSEKRVQSIATKLKTLRSWTKIWQDLPPPSDFATSAPDHEAILKKALQKQRTLEKLASQMASEKLGEALVSVQECSEKEPAVEQRKSIHSANPDSEGNSETTSRSLSLPVETVEPPAKPPQAFVPVASPRVEHGGSFCVRPLMRELFLSPPLAPCPNPHGQGTVSNGTPQMRESLPSPMQEEPKFMVARGSACAPDARCQSQDS